MAAPFEVFFADAIADKLLNPIPGGSVGGSGVDGVDETIVARLAFPDEFPEVGSIRLTLTGPDGLVATRLERAAPYALFGDLDGDLFAGPPLPFGDYRLDLAAYADVAGRGPALTDFTTWFQFGPNRPPSVYDHYVVSQGTSTVIDLLGNAYDPDYDQLSVVSVDAPLGGFAVILGDEIVYGPSFIDTPNGLKTFVGRDAFDYVVTDGALQSTARVFVDVEGEDGTEEFLVRFADAESDAILGTLRNNAYYDVDADILQRLTVLVDLSPFARLLQPGDFQSVRLILDRGAVVRTENLAPYALFGDDTMGDFFDGGGLGFGLPNEYNIPGSHELQVQAFTGRNGGGEPIASAFFSFELNERRDSTQNYGPAAVSDRFVIDATSTVLDVLFNDYHPELEPFGLVAPPYYAKVPLGGDLIVGPDSLTYIPKFFQTPGGMTPFIGVDSFQYSVSDGQSTSAGEVEVIIDGVVVQTEFLLQLVDVVTDEVIADLTPYDPDLENATWGASVPASLKGRLGLSVTVSPFAVALKPEHIGSLSMVLNRDEPGQIDRVENVAPYALFGDWNGDFFGEEGGWKAEDASYIYLHAFTKPDAEGDLFAIARYSVDIDFTA